MGAEGTTRNLRDNTLDVAESCGWGKRGDVCAASAATECIIAISDGGTDRMTKTFDGRRGTMIDKDFGKLMLRERKKQGLTQAELAEKAGISTMTIRRYESGDRKPRLEEALKISDALSINGEAIAMRDGKIIEERMERRRVTRSILRIWGNALYLLNRLEKEREAFRAWADDARITLRAYVMTGVPGGGRKSDLSDVIARYEARAEEFDAMERKTDEERSKILRIKSAVDDVVAELEMAQRKVLEYRYIDGHGWQYIAMRMNYDERQVRRLEAQAVDFISERVEVQKLGEK